MVVPCRVAISFSFAVATVSGRSLRADPWEGATDYMAQYTSDASKDATTEGTDTFAPEASSAPSSADSWLRAPTANTLTADVAALSPTSRTDAWLKAPGGDALSIEAAPLSSTDSMGVVPTSPVSASSNPALDSNSWLKQSTDSWAFAMPHAVPDARYVSSPDDVSIPHEDASTVGQGHTQAQLVGGRDSIGDDASEGASEDTNSGVAVHVQASGSIGGLFDGGEDRGRRGGSTGNSQVAAKADASNHAGGAVVNVRLDSELQESR